MSSSNPSQSQHESPTNNFTVPLIHEAIIPKLLDLLSRAKGSLNEDNIEDYGKMDTQLGKLRNDLNYIQRSFSVLKKFEENAKGLFNLLNQHTAEDSLADLIDNVRNPTLPVEQLRSKLCIISEIVLELKHMIASPMLNTRSYDFGTRFKRVETRYDELPDFHCYTLFNRSDTFEDFRVIYNGFDPRTKLCLLCFALIPENEVVKKRLFAYWWVGEGFISPPVSGEKMYEEMADEIFEKLMNAGFIEPINKNHSLVAGSYKMKPFIRSVVIELAKETKFFDFDVKGNPTADFSKSYRACLVRKDSTQKKLKIGSEFDQEKLETIFNVSQPYPDFFELDWFSKLKNVKVLYLGRRPILANQNIQVKSSGFVEWGQALGNQHIQVKSSEFLKGLRSMKFLRFFSLQGISGITKLPDSVCKLSSLRILDLRACYGLGVLPDGIGSLKKLTHLDISECYNLEYIPKGMALLSELQVLKGFAVGHRISRNSCTLNELSGLRKLRKLSIYANEETFPTDEQVRTLQRFEMLQKLTITWVGLVDRYRWEFQGTTQPTVATTMTPRKSGDKKKQGNGTAGLARKLLKRATLKQGTKPVNLKDFEKLEKLDLQCYPQMTTPSWLIPGKLNKLKKLYIRGGKLQILGQIQENDMWEVEILRLRFLSELKMDWRELQTSFPLLIYLEKVNCPNFTGFPFDGEWVMAEAKKLAMK